MKHSECVYSENCMRRVIQYVFSDSADSFSSHRDNKYIYSCYCVSENWNERVSQQQTDEV